MLKFFTPALLIAVFFFDSNQAEAVSISGSITYEKIVYSRGTGASVTLESTITHPLPKAIVYAYDSSNTVVAFTHTDENGDYTITNAASLIRLEVASENTQNSGLIVGSDKNSDIVSSPYTAQVSSLRGDGSGVDLTIPISNSSAGFNVFTQLIRGQDWFANEGFTFQKKIKAVWPGVATQFDPSLFILEVQNALSDPDGFDDDIILHEFGHMAAEEFSVDHSEGGPHSIISRVDLRLSWSEGLAHFLSSAIRNDPEHIDSLGSVATNGVSQRSRFNISTPGSKSRGSDNELAVASVLWNAKVLGSAKQVIDTLISFKSLPNEIQDDPISLDTFHDIWLAAAHVDLANTYLDMDMSYQKDDVRAFNIVDPFPILSPEAAEVDLTFFSNGDKDYFIFSASAGKNYEINTGNTFNGALTTLKVFLSSNNLLVATNTRRAPTSSGSSSGDMSSYIFLPVTEDAEYTIEVSRFRSSTRNFGYGGNFYGKTAGRYGSYSLGIQTTSSPTADPISGGRYFSSSTGSIFDTPDVSTGSGGGGGCFIQ